MPRPRYQRTEADVLSVPRWVEAQWHDTTWPQPNPAHTAWHQFPREEPTVAQFQNWYDQY